MTLTSGVGRERGAVAKRGMRRPSRSLSVEPQQPTPDPRVLTRLGATTMAEQLSDPAHLSTPTKATSSSPPYRLDSPDEPPSAADGPPTSDDPIVVFSPSGSPLTETDAISLVEDIRQPPTEGEAQFYIEVPDLPEEQKTLYQPVFGDQSIMFNSTLYLDEFTDIAGEHKIDGELYYFARDPDGILHRVSVIMRLASRRQYPTRSHAATVKRTVLQVVVWSQATRIMQHREVIYCPSALLWHLSMRLGVTGSLHFSVLLYAIKPSPSSLVMSD